MVLTVVALPIFAGTGLSFVLEQWMQPRPISFWRRPGAAFAIHVALWLLVFTVELAVFRRPWFAMANVLALQLFVVLVSNAKFHSLREPFIYQDFEYFSDALKHPRLYLPFLGVVRAVIALAGFGLAFYAGFTLESSLSARMPVLDFLGMLAALTVAGLALLWCGARGTLQVIFAPETDLRQLGLLTSLWRYAQEERKPACVPCLPSVQDFKQLGQAPLGGVPHLVVVQSESFFDARRLFPGIRSQVLQAFDAVKASAVCQGQVEVAAWGANTVRTEFAFLSGLGPASLGVHRFNPYRKLARTGVPTMASFLRSLGYRTVCVHPYFASFYTRDEVFPLLGFDEFIDIESFKDVEKTGPYIGDVALAEKVCALLQKSSNQPIFVFVISMENHGPLHLEKVHGDDVARLYSNPPPEGCDDLTIYLRHLGQADRMVAMLRDQLDALPGDGWLCWFGDHVPIMPKAYAATAAPDGKTDYLIWQKENASDMGSRLDVNIEDLGGLLLQKMGLISSIDTVSALAEDDGRCAMDDGTILKRFIAN